MKKSNEKLVCSSYLDDNYKDLEEYRKEIAERLEEEVQTISDETLWDRWSSDQDFIWQDFKEEFESFMKDKTILLIGTLGLWTGKHNTGKVIETSDNFFSVLCNYDDVKIWVENGKTYLNLYHHDGANHLEIRLVNTDRVATTLEKHFSYYDNLEDLGWDKLAKPYYSKKIDLCKLMYS